MGTTALRGPLASVDFTTKADSDSLGNGWIDGHTWDPTVYEPLGIRDGGVVVTDPTSRDVEYGADQTGIGNGSVEGNLVGIACAWRPTTYDTPSVTITWAGYNTPAAWIEATPLLHVTPGTPEHGFGMWLSRFGIGGPSFVIAGSISNPSSDFHSNVLASALIPSHTDGQSREFTMVSDGEGVTGWLDGVQLSFSTYGTDPVPIPGNLLGSTLHGFALDTHLTADWSDIPDFPGIYDWSIAA